MPGFIQVPAYGRPQLINVDSIVRVYLRGEDNANLTPSTALELEGGSVVVVDMDYDQVITLLHRWWDRIGNRRADQNLEADSLTTETFYEVKQQILGEWKVVAKCTFIGDAATLFVSLCNCATAAPLVLKGPGRSDLAFRSPPNDIVWNESVSAETKQYAESRLGLHGYCVEILNGTHVGEADWQVIARCPSLEIARSIERSYPGISSDRHYRRVTQGGQVVPDSVDASSPIRADFVLQRRDRDDYYTRGWYDVSIHRTIDDAWDASLECVDENTIALDSIRIRHAGLYETYFYPNSNPRWMERLQARVAQAVRERESETVLPGEET